MSRSQLLKTHFVSLKSILLQIQHTDCRILEDHIRDQLIDGLVKWYVDNCGALDTADVLRKGWKGFEYMDDIELIEDWLKTLQLGSRNFSDEQFVSMYCAEDIESALNLKLKLAEDIFEAG